jgi:P27 family predicted phage terminase small subunit
MTERKKGDRAGRAAAKLTKAYTPEFPEQLGPVARLIWDRLMPVLIEKGHFKPGNEIGVVMICHTYAEWITAAEAQHKYGSVIKTKKGNFVQSPYASVANQNASLLLSLLKDYGLTPATRLPSLSDGSLLDLSDLVTIIPPSIPKL